MYLTESKLGVSVVSHFSVQSSPILEPLACEVMNAVIWI